MGPEERDGALTQAFALDHHHLSSLSAAPVPPQDIRPRRGFRLRHPVSLGIRTIPGKPGGARKIFGPMPETTARNRAPRSVLSATPPPLPRRKGTPMHTVTSRPPPPPARRRDRRPLRRRRLRRQRRPRRLRIGHHRLRRGQRAGSGRHDPDQRPPGRRRAQCGHRRRGSDHGPVRRHGPPVPPADPQPAPPPPRRSPTRSTPPSRRSSRSRCPPCGPPARAPTTWWPARWPPWPRSSAPSPVPSP